MISKIKSLFSKKEVKTKETLSEYNPMGEEIQNIKKYDFSDFCQQCIFGKSGECKADCNNWKKDFQSDKKIFLIVDDNKGIISIVDGLLNELHNEKRINLDEWNILKFDGSEAGLFFLKFLLKNEVEKIDAALVDITFGNILRIFGKNIKINGIHLVYFLKQKFPNMNFYFYTGNTLNEYIKYQKNMKDFFNEKFNEPIEKYLIQKMNTSDEKLKNYLEELFKGKVNENE